MTRDVEKQCWYPLDGCWHKSVASKMSALHLKAGERKGAMCNPQRTALLEDDGYSEKEAISTGRTFCKRCCKAAGIPTPSGDHSPQ